MPQLVNNGSLIKCSFGVAPSSLIATSAPTVMLQGQPAATIMDFAPMTNILPFGMCSAPTNPQVIAAQGSPVPCVPVTVAPWTPGSTKALIAGKPALHSACTCMCTWAGVITVTTSMAPTVNVSG